MRFRRSSPPLPTAGRRPYRVLGWLALGVLFLLLVSWTQKGDLPGPGSFRAELFEEPIQTETDRPSFVMSYRKKSIEVRPVAEYELWGLVVSHNSIESIADIYHDSSSVDTKDLCVVWGDNLRSADLRKVEFKGGPWTCYFRSAPDVAFDGTALGNNHMITDRPRLRKKLDRVRVGDQIHFRGALVNYQVEDWQDFWRNSSTVRTDGGDGACEVVFFEDLEVVVAGTPGWYSLFNSSLFLLALVPLAFAYLVWLDSKRFSHIVESPRLTGPIPDIYTGNVEDL